MSPCCLCGLDFGVELPEDREIQVRSAQVNTGNTTKTLTGQDRKIQVITEIQVRSA